jgi:hypothetical protein
MLSFCAQEAVLAKMQQQSEVALAHQIPTLASASVAGAECLQTGFR